MNPFGPFGNMMPYSNFHGMNLDWVIQIAKDFLDQYTHIQETIDTGLDELDQKAQELQSLLDQWYDEHSQDIANELVQAIQDFHEAAAAYTEEVIQSIPEDYTTLSNTVRDNGYGLWASLDINPSLKITYHTDTHILDIPTGGYVMYKGRYHALSGAVNVDLSSALDPYPISNLWVLDDYSIIATYGSTTPVDTSAQWLGFVRDEVIFINGIAPETIQVVNTSGVNPGIKNAGAYVGLTTTQNIVYETTTKTITIPQGFYVYNGVGHSTQAGGYTIDWSSISTAALLVLGTDGIIYPISWSTGKPKNSNDITIGYVYGHVLWINGVPAERITIKESDGNFVRGTYISPGLVGLAQNSGYVVWDYDNKILTIPAAFSIWRGYGRARSQNVINVSSILYGEACSFFIKPDGTIYAKDWRKCYAENQEDQYIGYVFRKQVFLFGVPESQIVVQDSSAGSNVFCFGDSITAGAGAATLYHMILHSYKPNLTFYNYGVGSTGYILEATGSVVVGGGVIGDGTTRTEAGNNNVPQVMSSVISTIPNMIIFAGTNDWALNYTAAQFRAAVQGTLELAITKTPRILVITPIHRTNDGQANTAGLTLHDYSEIIIEECEARGIAYIDGFDISINPADSTMKTAFITDGIHPNDAGHRKIARAVYNKMLEAFAM